MEFLIELIFELVFEFGGEVATNKKVSKWIRYPLMAIFILIFASVIGLILVMGIAMLDKNIIAGLFFIALGIFFLVGSIYKAKKVYKKLKIDKVVEIELLIKGNKEEVVNKLLSEGFKIHHHCRTIANYYLPSNEALDDITKIKEKSVRLRKSITKDYQEGFKLGNFVILDKEKYNKYITKSNKEFTIKTDKEAIGLEKLLLNDKFTLIYTDDKDDTVLNYNDEFYFQIQDLKSIGLIIAYDNPKYYHLDEDMQRNKLIEDIKKFGIEPLNNKNINRFKALEKEDYKPIKIEKIIKILK